MNISFLNQFLINIKFDAALSMMNQTGINDAINSTVLNITTQASTSLRGTAMDALSAKITALADYDDTVTYDDTIVYDDDYANTLNIMANCFLGFTLALLAVSVCITVCNNNSNISRTNHSLMSDSYPTYGSTTIFVNERGGHGGARHEHHTHHEQTTHHH
ncbi:MAG: hypothetical protein P1U36_07660 [Legionellaceae bacterium]|nr:hypothetical protein [Legionellaceae bacterium]